MSLRCCCLVICQRPKQEFFNLAVGEAGRLRRPGQLGDAVPLINVAKADLTRDAAGDDLECFVPRPFASRRQLGNVAIE